MKTILLTLCLFLLEVSGILAQSPVAISIINPDNQLVPSYGDNPHFIGNMNERAFTFTTWITNLTPNSLTLEPLRVQLSLNAGTNRIRFWETSWPRLDLAPGVTVTVPQTYTRFEALDIPDGDYQLCVMLSLSEGYVATTLMDVRIEQTDLYVVPSDTSSFTVPSFRAEVDLYRRQLAQLKLDGARLIAKAAWLDKQARRKK